MRTRLMAAAAAMGFFLTAWAGASVIDTTPGLLYHLDPALNVTQSAGNVTAWNDANSNGVTFTQSTSAKEPTFIASSANFNNNPVINFNGSLVGNTSSGGPSTTAGQLIDTGSTTGVQTVIIVNRTTSTNGLDGIWGVEAADNGIRRKDSNTWQGTTNGGNTNDFPTSMIVNGATTYTAALNAPVIMIAQGNSLNLGSTGLGEYFRSGTVTPRPWGGDVAEVAVYNTILTSTQIQSIDSYLSAKYSIALAPEPASLGVLSVAALGLLRRRRGGK